MLVASFAEAQTGIGTTTPNASAKLDVYSTNKGFLPPRVTLTSATDASTIASPAEGLLVYNLGSSGLQAGYYYWNNTSWSTIATATSAGNGVTAMDMVKLYGEAWSNATGKIGNTNGYTFTVPVSGRYLFDFSSSGYLNQASMSITFKVRQGTTDLGTDIFTNVNNNVHVVFTGMVEVNLSAGVTYNVYVSSNGSRDGGDYDRVFYKLVAGNLPVTGQTVEYGIARYTGADVGSLSAGALVSFDATAAGNLTWSGNKFTLKANKTYIIEASLAIYAGTPSAGRFQIYNYTGSGSSLANGLFISQGGSGTYYPNANTPMKCIVTPTTDIQVGIRLEGSYGAAPGIIGNTSVVGAFASSNVSYFSVQQIGSSAIINPWTLSETNTYNTTGNVGIGTTTPGDLLVVGSSFALHDGGDKVIGMGWSPGSGKAILAGYPAEIRFNPSTGKLSLGTDPTSRSIGSSPGVQRRMTITSGGQVGIGTENPGATLEIGSSNGSVPGSLVLNPTTTGTGVEGAEINFRPAPVTTSPAAQIWAIDQVSNANSPRLRFFPTTSGETYGFTIRDNGYLGIGTGTPSNKLHVQSSDATSVYIESTTSDNNGMLILNANTSQNWANNWHEFIYFRNQGNNIGGIIASNGGNMVSYGTTSDYRLKRDLREFSGLDLVNKIKTYDFAWRRDSSRMFGVMAHELQAILPYAVNGQKNALDVNGKIIPQSVDYGKLTPILVKAIQEQDVIIKEQVNKLIKLSKEKDSIEKRVSDLELLIKKLIEKNN